MIQDLLNRPGAVRTADFGEHARPDDGRVERARPTCLCCRERPLDKHGYCDECRHGRRSRPWFRLWHVPIILLFGYILSPQRRELVSPVCAGLSAICESLGAFATALRFAEWEDKWHVVPSGCLTMEWFESKLRSDRRECLRTLAGVAPSSDGIARNPRDIEPRFPASFEVSDDD